MSEAKAKIGVLIESKNEMLDIAIFEDGDNQRLRIKNESGSVEVSAQSAKHVAESMLELLDIAKRMEKAKTQPDSEKEENTQGDDDEQDVSEVLAAHRDFKMAHMLYSALKALDHRANADVFKAAEKVRSERLENLKEKIFSFVRELVPEIAEDLTH